MESRYRLAKKPQCPLSRSRLQLKSKDNTFKTIPFKQEIPNLIEAAHNGFAQSTIKHSGINMTLRNLKGPSMELYWANMASDVRENAAKCLECLKEQPIKEIKVYKPIIPNGPFDRFTADLYKLPEDMIKASGTKHSYILSCVDHFSKYKWTELIPNKEAQTVSHKLELIFNSFRPPVHFQSDNGKEFQNSEINNLCRRMNIKQIHGRPYYPQSQGVVEKLNDLIARSLNASLRKFQNDESDETWDIEGSLKAWTIKSNKNVHSVTQLMPYIAIQIKSDEEIRKVQDNIRQFYAKR